MAGNMFWQRADSFQATLLLLALADFHREHKRYPESLAELAPTYFAEVPRDPKTVGPFVYFPQGVPEDLTVGAEEQGDLQIVARKETPFLVTTNGSARVQSRQQADGTWSFMDHIGMPIELSAAVRRYDLRIWPAEEP